MDNLWAWLASLPTFVIYAFIGALCGGLGGLIGLFCKGFWSKAPRWVPVILVAVSTQVSSPVVTRLKAQGSIDAAKQADAAMSGIAKTRLFQVIFDYYPEAKEEMRASFQKILAGPQNQIAVRSQQLGATIADRYLNLSIIAASDAAIHKLLKTNSRILEGLEKKPQTCVGFHLGTGIKPGDISTADANAILDVKADIIESSKKSPSANREKLTPEQMLTALIASYEKNGLVRDKALAEIGKLESLNSLPAEEGCTIARHFNAALANMDEKMAASVFSGLTAIALGK